MFLILGTPLRLLKKSNKGLKKSYDSSLTFTKLQYKVRDYRDNLKL